MAQIWYAYLQIYIYIYLQPLEHILMWLIFSDGIECGLLAPDSSVSLIHHLDPDSWRMQCRNIWLDAHIYIYIMAIVIHTYLHECIPTKITQICMFLPISSFLPYFSRLTSQLVALSVFPVKSQDFSDAEVSQEQLEWLRMVEIEFWWPKWDWILGILTSICLPNSNSFCWDSGDESVDFWYSVLYFQTQIVVIETTVECYGISFNQQQYDSMTHGFVGHGLQPWSGDICRGIRWIFFITQQHVMDLFNYDIHVYIYNPLRLLRICVFPIMQLNSNATLLRICPHFVLICFLPIWPSLWKPLYISMQPVYIIDYIETACLYNTILCDVNCILSKCFQVQLWGCPGKPKFQFHILSKRSGLYIYIYK